MLRVLQRSVRVSGLSPMATRHLSGVGFVEERREQSWRFPNQIGGLLRLELQGDVKVKVIPTGQDETKITLSQHLDAEDFLKVVTIEKKNVVSIASQERIADGTVLEAEVPYHSNVHVDCKEGAVDVAGYLEGDLFVEAGHGIDVAKVRGQTVFLKSTSGDVKIHKHLEGWEVRLVTEKGNIATPKLLGHTLSVSCNNGDTKIGAGFVEKGRIHVNEGSLDINGYHGSLVTQVFSSQADHKLNVRGMNGYLDASAEHDATVHFDALRVSKEDEPSVVTSAAGNVSITLPTDQTIRVSARAQGKVNLPNEQETSRNQQVTAIVEAKPEVIDLSANQMTSGKVNYREVSKPEMLFTESDNSVANQKPLPPITPLSVNAGLGSITIEQMGWKDRIMKRFLSHENDASSSR